MNFISCVAATDGSENQHLKSEGFIIRYTEDEQSKHWGNYLFTHLQKRASDKSKILKGETDLELHLKGYIEILFEIAPEIQDDYCILQRNEFVHIRVKNESTALWITYQLIDRIAEVNSDYNVHDLPPAIIDFNTHCRIFHFEYRDPHFMPNLDADYSAILGTNMVEEDWGIWGHNLSKVLEPSMDIYAKVDGETVKEQYCFSSANLYQQLKEYIIDEYGFGDRLPTRFMINPNDNDLVCTDVRCEKLGNNSANASPAIVALLNKLADEFPKHSFFTTAYRTVMNAPRQVLNKNVGVLFSTIAISKGTSLDGDKDFQVFKTNLNAWKEKTDEIYLWDYFSNFDDYLSPLPIFSGLKKQLPVFKKLGVKGVFLNGSGYHYSSFEDLKTFVSAALLMNTHLATDDLVNRYFKRFYPISQQVLSNYFLALEERINQNNKPYLLYASISSAMDNYLKVDEFVGFYEKMAKLHEQTKGEERKRVEKLLVALSFTRLQIAYKQGTEKHGYLISNSREIKTDASLEPVLHKLNQFVKYDNLTRYKEVGGDLDEYSRQWAHIFGTKIDKNNLVHAKVDFISNPDEGYENSAVLMDGVLGFYSDYHLGWLLANGENIAVRLQADFKQVKRMKICFLKNTEHGIYPPEKVLIMHNSQVLYEFEPGKTIHEKRLFNIDVPVSFDGHINAVQIKMIRSNANSTSTVALDEIQLLKN